jgi:holo-[acyl-carrier protein] synthase
MIAGLGVDICDTARVARVYQRFGRRFEQRLLTPAERAERPSWSAGALARRWACKEAVAKALGTGVGRRVGFQQIQVLHDTCGAPRCSVAGIEGEVLLSVTDDAGRAVAFALWQRA